MRVVFLALLMLNLGLAAFFLLQPDQPRSSPHARDFNHEGIRLLRPEEVEALRPPVRVAAAAPVCLRWLEVAADGSEQAERALQQIDPVPEYTQLPAAQNIKFWVILGPERTATAAQTRARELAKKDVKDYFVLPENDTWAHAISLGVFSSRESADRRVREISGKGFPDVDVYERPAPTATVAFEFKNVSAQQKQALTRLAGRYSGSALQEVACN